MTPLGYLGYLLGAKIDVFNKEFSHKFKKNQVMHGRHRDIACQVMLPKTINGNT